MPDSFGSHYRQALARVTATLGVPFGYTLTVWASGALAMHDFGPPGPLRVGAFVGGAVAVYLLFGALEYPDVPFRQPLRARRVVLFNGIPIAAAGLVAAVDRLAPSPFWGWLLSGAVASGAYILLLAAAWALDARLQQAQRGEGRSCD